MDITPRYHHSPYYKVLPTISTCDFPTYTAAVTRAAAVRCSVCHAAVRMPLQAHTPLPPLFQRYAFALRRAGYAACHVRITVYYLSFA